jgi:putative transposase
VVKPSRPDELWEADMSYIWCGRDGWCYLFNVIDTFSRRWIGYAFDTTASKRVLSSQSQMPYRHQNQMYTA